MIQINGLKTEAPASVRLEATPLAYPIANCENLARYETAGPKFLGDQKYLELIKKAAGILAPNTLHEEIWRTL